MHANKDEIQLQPGQTMPSNATNMISGELDAGNCIDGLELDEVIQSIPL